MAEGRFLHLALVTLLSYLKFQFLNIGLGFQRGKAGIRAPEDSGKGGIPDNQVFNTTTTNEDAARAARMVQNELENVPLFLIIYVIAGFNTEINDDVYAIFGYAFVTMRLLHTLCYQWKLMPYRSIFFAIGWLLSIVLAIMAVVM